jgi:hypothetical protein
MPEIPRLVGERYDDWVAWCGVCGAGFAVRLADSPENPHPNGCFCPDCQGRKLMAPGVLNWRMRAEAEADIDV